MTTRSVRLLTTLAVMASAAAVAATAPSAATAGGPHQFFQGLVNMRASGATIGVACTGAANVGHPLPDQTVAVELVIPPVTATEGYTGLAATSIVAWLNWPSPVAPPPAVKVADFTAYGTAAIPAGITVPCSGTGVMSFVPAPDDGGRVSTVDVTFVSIGA
jgi:hypothetical protein